MTYVLHAREHESLETSNVCRRYKNVGVLSLVPNRSASDTVSHFTNVILWWGGGRKKKREGEGTELRGSEKCMY